MTDHLTQLELFYVQRDGRVQMLHELAQQCRRRYLRSAALVCAQDKAVQQLQAFATLDRVDLGPLIDSWTLLCRRYREAVYNPQLALFPNVVLYEPARWRRFVYGRLLPRFVDDDDTVRNVLRALGALPCNSPREAGRAFWTHVENLHLSRDSADWLIKDHAHL